MRWRTVAVPSAVTATLVLGAAVASADAPSSSEEPHDPAVSAVLEELAAERAELESVDVTDEQRRDATFPVDAADATFPLDAADAGTEIATETETGDSTLVTLTADLLFDFGSVELTDRAAEVVEELAGEIPQGATVRVDGHTDSVGSEGDNQRLSEERAGAVADVLRDARGDLDLQARGHGETDPVADNTVGGEDNPAGRALNRRVEVTYPTS
ncbi:hypothetical protein GCM10009718_07420 [Isoptericola halotolerans]